MQVCSLSSSNSVITDCTLQTDTKIFERRIVTNWIFNVCLISVFSDCFDVIRANKIFFFFFFFFFFFCSCCYISNQHCSLNIESCKKA